MMEPAVPKTTTQKLHVPLFCVIIINECQITMFSPCGTWSSLFQFTRLLKGKSIFQFSRAQMFFFFFLLCIWKAEMCPLQKASKVGTWVQGSLCHSFILLAWPGMMSPATADSVVKSCIPNSLCWNPFKPYSSFFYVKYVLSLWITMCGCNKRKHYILAKSHTIMAISAYLSLPSEDKNHISFSFSFGTVYSY